MLGHDGHNQVTTPILSRRFAGLEQDLDGTTPPNRFEYSVARTSLIISDAEPE